jgi:hypothetical protein
MGVGLVVARRWRCHGEGGDCCRTARTRAVRRSGAAGSAIDAPVKALGAPMYANEGGRGHVGAWHDQRAHDAACRLVPALISVAVPCDPLLGLGWIARHAVGRVLGSHSAASGSNGGNCVEVGTTVTGTVAGIRDSKSPERGHLVVAAETFGAFLAAVKSGRYGVARLPTTAQPRRIPVPGLIAARTAAIVPGRGAYPVPQSSTMTAARSPATRPGRNRRAGDHPANSLSHFPDMKRPPPARRMRS